MKILILAGGTGSIAIQKSFYGLEREIEGIDVKILTNAYDHGLSTGVVRKVAGCKILGPSDVRKNQTTRLGMENPNSPWLKFLNVRFSCHSSKAKDSCLDVLENAQVPKGKILSAINTYFSQSSALSYDYSDFSLANIIYAGLALENGNSLRAAAKIMAELMGIKDNVILNDDESLLLGAETVSGHRIHDEADIVSWNNPTDPIVSCFYTTPEGALSRPVLCSEAREAILQADLIVLSSGTQWSSLIPTYDSVGFKEAVGESKAKIIMVMNKVPDKDAPGQTASDLIKNIVPKYFQPNTLSVIVDEYSDSKMLQFNESRDLAKIILAKLSMGDEWPTNTHDNTPAIAIAIMKEYFSDYLDSEMYVFDFDDTLVARGNTMNKTAEYNLGLLNHRNIRGSTAICTGNSISHVLQQLNNSHFPILKDCLVYAESGVNLYSINEINTPKLERCLDPSKVLSDAEVRTITDILSSVVKIPLSRIEVRSNSMVCIRPIESDLRHAVWLAVKNYLGEKYDIEMTGRSTIEIKKEGLNKTIAMKDLVENKKYTSITYVGDEIMKGNDFCVKSVYTDIVKPMCVKTPSETALFLTILTKTT